MAFSTGYTFAFATAICISCSLAVAATSLGLRDRIEVNKKRDTQGSILIALGLPEDGHKLTGEEIDELWETRVKLVIIDKEGKPVTDHDLDDDGDTDQRDVQLARLAVRFKKDDDGSSATPDILAVFARKDAGDVVGSYAIPLHGPGLWGPLSGYLAIDPGGQQTIGATFFAPKETPGLGSEICETKWEDMWKGKRIVKDGSGHTIDVIKPGIPCPTDPEYCVDGISGATITSRGVDIMVEEAITKHYDEYLAGIRSGR